MVGMVEVFASIGTSAGPIFGGFIYQVVGYSGTFYLYGAINLAFSICLWFLFPRNLDMNSESAPNDNEYCTAEEPTIKVTYCGLLRRGRYLMALLSATMTYFAYCMLEPILAQRLIHDFSMTPT